MKQILLFIIQIYWKLIPASRRRVCIFNESCSRYVYRITREEGFWKGIKAFKTRYKQCRPGYKVFYNSDTNTPEVELSNKKKVPINEMAEGIIKKYSY